MTSWHHTLDVYEASLGHHQHLLDFDTVDGSNPWPPADLPDGPVPDDLRARAVELLSRSNLLIDEVAAKMANIPELKPNRRQHHSTPDQPRWTATL